MRNLTIDDLSENCTGYLWFRDIETNNYKVMIYKNGECVGKYQTADKAKFEEFLETVKND